MTATLQTLLPLLAVLVVVAIVYENGLGMPANLGWLHRGVAYWRSGDDERVVMLTAFAHMIALDAKRGSRCRSSALMAGSTSRKAWSDPSTVSITR